MKKLLMASVLLIAFNSEAAETYKLDPNHTNITWQANHFGFSSPSGKFNKSDGTLVLDRDNIEKSKLDVTIDTSGIVTGIEKFDGHLKSKDFFNVTEFPKAVFKSTSVKKIDNKNAKVNGNLTMLGITKPLTLKIKLNKEGENPMSKIKTLGFTASTKIKRSDWGLNYAIPGVSDEVKLDIEAEANLVK